MGGGHTIRVLWKEEEEEGRLKGAQEERGGGWGVWWVVGSSSSMPFTLLSVLRCLHFQPNSPGDPDYDAEADDIQSILPKGLEVIGSILVGVDDRDAAIRAGKYAFNMNSRLSSDADKPLGVIAANFVENKLGVKYHIYKSQGDPELEAPEEIIHETEPSNFLWKKMCILRCEMQLHLPIYGLPFEKGSDSEDAISIAVDMILADLKSSRLYCLMEGLSVSSKQHSAILLKTGELGKLTNNAATSGIGGNSQIETLQCLHFSSISARGSQVPNPLKLTFLVNRSDKNGEAFSPFAEFLPASHTTTFNLLKLQIDVLCMGSNQLYLAEALSSLAIPALMDQLSLMKKVAKQAVAELPQLHAFHFCPDGFLHPISCVYDLSYNELEATAAEFRKNLHCRLGLPLDRPLLRLANALSFSMLDHSSDYRGGAMTSSSEAMPSYNVRLRNVHIGLQRSGVIGGRTSLIQGTYEYYHYLHDGFDDKGWGCAYRSLQTIVSWFKFQHYTAVEVPSHRKIQETLVEIGDKEPLFLGSKEWIGAIELSFVLDKLLGVTCKILNVRSGSELPEKCRELLFHFETQGTPVMIGGGVLAYTLLGVDYNEATGESAFLILDPHYTGSDDLKAIWSGDWCGWKRAISIRGEEFFLRNTFYNLLLPQRPNTV